MASRSYKQMFLDNKNEIFVIIIYHILSQGLMLFLTGRWCDDWCVVNMSKEGMLQWACELGRPDVFPCLWFVERLPTVFYRVFVFLSYFIIALCFYFVAKKVFSYNNAKALILVLVYMAVPVNDIRIIRTYMPYTLGLLFYCIAFLLIVYWYDNFSFFKRITVLVFFFFSFILNSLLVFYCLVLLYILMKERSFKGVICKFDFICLPIVFFILKTIFFSSHGVYSGYNKVSFASLMLAIKNVFTAGRLMLQNVTLSLLARPVIVCSVVIAFYILYFVFDKYKPEWYVTYVGGEVEAGNNMALFFVGVIMLLAGLFPYVVVRHSPNIALSDFNGRDAILVPFGISVMFTCVLYSLCNRRTIIVLVAVFMLSGMSFFTFQYIDYQAVNYWDRGLQENLKRNPELANKKTIYIVGDGFKGRKPWYWGLNFYQYNGIFEEVYSDETRFVFDQYSNGAFFDTEGSFNSAEIKEREWYNMSNYDTSHKGVDAVVMYSNTIGLRQSVKLRYKELLGTKISGELVRNSSIKITYPSMEEFYEYIKQ